MPLPQRSKSGPITRDISHARSNPSLLVADGASRRARFVVQNRCGPSRSLIPSASACSSVYRYIMLCSSSAFPLMVAPLFASLGIIKPPCPCWLGGNVLLVPAEPCHNQGSL